LSSERLTTDLGRHRRYAAPAEGDRGAGDVDLHAGRITFMIGMVCARSRSHRQLERLSGSIPCDVVRLPAVHFAHARYGPLGECRARFARRGGLRHVRPSVSEGYDLGLFSPLLASLVSWETSDTPLLFASPYCLFLHCTPARLRPSWDTCLLLMLSQIIECFDLRLVQKRRKRKKVVPRHRAWCSADPRRPRALGSSAASPVAGRTIVPPSSRRRSDVRQRSWPVDGPRRVTKFSRMSPARARLFHIAI